MCYDIKRTCIRSMVIKMQIEQNLTIQQKLQILSDAAKYDVACTSSGIDRRGKAGSIGNTLALSLIHI